MLDNIILLVRAMALFSALEAPSDAFDQGFGIGCVWRHRATNRKIVSAFIMVLSVFGKSKGYRYCALVDFSAPSFYRTEQVPFPNKNRMRKSYGVLFFFSVVGVEFYEASVFFFVCVPPGDNFLDIDLSRNSRQHVSDFTRQPFGFLCGKGSVDPHLALPNRTLPAWAPWPPDGATSAQNRRRRISSGTKRPS